MAPEVVALIPVKPLSIAKGRLAPALTAAERQALTLLCLHRALKAIQEARLVRKSMVIGSDEAVSRLTNKMGASWLQDPGWDLNESLREGFSHIFKNGAEACLFLPADLPLLTPENVDGIVAASKDLSRLVLAPAHDGGTNSILLPKGVPFNPRMSPESLALHLEEAKRIGIPTKVYEKPSLAFDVDTPQDLHRLQEHLPALSDELGKWHVFQGNQRLACPTKNGASSKAV